MPKLNSQMHRARAGKNDEFYTRIDDINIEMKNYGGHFRNKVIYCNCDDPRESKFYQHFKQKFHDYGLKLLITTCYKSDDSNLFSKHNSETSFARFFDGERERERTLIGDGDFASEECIEYLKQSDIVVTNPPFSLFREYIAQLINFDRKFIILGNMNAIANKEIFPLFQSNRVWYGVTGRKGAKFFVVPEGSPYDKIEDGVPLKSATVQWFTNLIHKKRHQELPLWAKYNPNDYPRYDNYDAIEVSKTVEIPKDYEGIMGVPVSFMDKYNPDQFEIIGLDRYTFEPIRTKVYTKEEMQIHGPLNGRTVLADVNGKLSQLYARILIRRKL